MCTGKDFDDENVLPCTFSRYKVIIRLNSPTYSTKTRLGSSRNSKNNNNYVRIVRTPEMVR